MSVYVYLLAKEPDDLAAALERLREMEQRCLAAEERAERYATVMRRCERWFTAYLEGHDDGQYEAGSILPAIRAALTEGSGES